MPLISYGLMNMQSDFRALMSEQYFLTRSYIVSLAADFGNKDVIATRLYALPVKQIEKIQMIFGTSSMSTLLHLLQMQVIYLITLTGAMKEGEQVNLDATTSQLYKNADDISAHYAGINPFWEVTQWRNLLYTYIAMTIDGTISLMANNFERDMDISARLLHHSLNMGDYLTSGVFQYLSVAQRNARVERNKALKDAVEKR